MSYNTRVIGTEYETLACEYLASQGMRILERNYRVRIGEIDIIALDRDELVFVEVKFRTSYGFAGYAINKAKQQTIRKVAQWYMKEKKISQNTFCRFDAVLVEGSEIEHIKNAWQ